MKKPTKDECLAWAADCDEKIIEYEKAADRAREDGNISDAWMWENYAGSRKAEAKALREFAKGCD